MLIKIFSVIIVVAGSIVAQDEKTKPTTTTTTIIYTKPRPPTTPDPTNSTPKFPTDTPLPPIVVSPTQPLRPPCCSSLNEIYLPPRIAPYCQVYCEDIGKECHMRFDIPEPFGCYCKPGYCRNKKGKCVMFYDAFFKYTFPNTTTTLEPTPTPWTNFTTLSTLPPPPQTLVPICCSGPNEVYLPPRIAPYCQVYCKDIGKRCRMRTDIPQPFGCYCKPGFCRNEKTQMCVPYSVAFKKCDYHEF
ncbi:uncharacterized protein LOC129911194 [Episyrphus balteatus]|uniref:uncharacterized protein LOC129911194 n=1 Tax=Episyrphus balteatus TaxID=286459 RepID=UPI002486B9FF|nr:uncharacterized protein LOC129911194 [Episyrphus balteatus]